MPSLGVAWFRSPTAFALAATTVLLFGCDQRPYPAPTQDPAPSTPPAMLSAKLDTAGGQHLFVAAYDPQRQAVVISSLVPPGTDPGHVHQLWLIPADGKPRSLGFVPVGASVKIPLAPPAAGLTDTQATLAISVEGPGGSKNPGPTGPVVAKGSLIKI